MADDTRQSRTLALPSRALWPATLALLWTCRAAEAGLLDPAGPVAEAQRAHLISVIGWTMIAVAPVLVGVPLLLWRYRYRNDKARYTPDWAFSGLLDVAMWGIPFLIITVLSVQLWHASHALDPYAPIDPGAGTVEVQVVGLDWKWLFVYPDLGIATVNDLAFPAGTNVALDLTTDTVMQSFMVNALAGQVYAMPGMRTKLHLLADAPGTFEGENTQFNGNGFAQQKFDATAMTPGEFDAWVARVRAEGGALDRAAYGRLAAASTGAQVHDVFGTPDAPARGAWFGTVAPELFEDVIARYNGGTPVSPQAQPGAEAYVPAALAPASPTQAMEHPAHDE